MFVGPPLATTLASTRDVWMLYRALRERGRFRERHHLRRKVPRLAIAAVLMGIAVSFVTPLISPSVAGSLFRRIGGLAALVASGFAVYAVACLRDGVRSCLTM